MYILTSALLSLIHEHRNFSSILPPLLILNYPEFHLFEISSLPFYSNFTSNKQITRSPSPFPLLKFIFIQSRISKFPSTLTFINLCSKRSEVLIKKEEEKNNNNNNNPSSFRNNKSKREEEEGGGLDRPHFLPIVAIPWPQRWLRGLCGEIAVEANILRSPHTAYGIIAGGIIKLTSTRAREIDRRSYQCERRRNVRNFSLAFDSSYPFLSNLLLNVIIRA